MGKKSDKAEIDRRIHAVVKLLASAKPSSYILRYCSQEWGVTERQGQTYLTRARDIIRADYTIERPDFLSSRLAILDEVIEASIKTKQHSNAVGALRLQAELTQLLKKQ